jgi:glyoxylase-like metal-dependent hydrolase (beta-lactamase superfamily II)
VWVVHADLHISQQPATNGRSINVTNYICVTCGTQYPPSDAPPGSCPICEDERQYVPADGQKWTTMEELSASGRFRNTFQPVAEGITAIVQTTGVGIGQRAHLVETPHGNVLWDLVVWHDDETIAEIKRRGGVVALTISHPHFFTTMGEWAAALDAPIRLHRDNEPFVMYPHPAIEYIDDEALEIVPGVTLIRCGGHFPGSSVLHWAGAHGGRGALLTGDTIFPVADPRWVTFMYSYPNDIPLNTTAVRRIVAAVEPYEFDALYGSFGGTVRPGAKGAVRRSAERYVRHISE